jgi:hypothetical protein
MKAVICSAEIAGFAPANRISTLGAEVVLLKSGCLLGLSGLLPHLTAWGW